MNPATLAALILAIASLATALGLTRHSRGDRNRTTAETDSLYATAAAQYATAASAMIDPLTQQLQLLRTRLNGTETDMAVVREQLKAATALAARIEASRTEDRDEADKAYRIAIGEIHKLRIRLDVDGTEAHRAIQAIRAEQERELETMHQFLHRREE